MTKPVATARASAGHRAAASGGERKQDAAEAVLGHMQARIGNPARHRGGEVDEVAVTGGSRPDDGIGEDDGVRLRPGDLFAEHRPEQRLIGRAGEARRAAERLVQLHEAAPVGAGLRRPAEKLGMDEVDRAHVQRRRNAHAPAEADKVLDEIEADLAVVQAAVHMRATDVDEAVRAERLAGADEEAHGEGGRLAAFAVQQGAVDRIERDHAWVCAASRRGAPAAIGLARRCIGSRMR